MEQTRRVHGVHVTAGAAGLGRLSRGSGRESPGSNYAYDWGLDDPVPADHFVRDAFAADYEVLLADSIPEDAGAVCLFLRHPPPHHLSLVRQVLQLASHP